MITLSITKLFEIIRETDTFCLPDMTKGTHYLYDSVYRKLLGGEDISLSEINFDSFVSDDITSLNNLHTDIFEKNERTADCITSELRRITPVYNPVSFV